MAGEGEFPKVAGDIAYSSEANLFYDKINEIYLGSAFDTSNGGVTTGSHIFSLVSGIVMPTYIKTRILGNWQTRSQSTSPSSTASVTSEIFTREISGAFVSSFSGTVAYQTGEHGGGGLFVQRDSKYPLEWVHTLSAAELGSGVQVMVVTASAAANGGASSFTNNQTVVESA